MCIYTLYASHIVIYILLHISAYICVYVLHRGLLALWDYMKSELGVDTDAVWEQIKDLAIKTIIRQAPMCICILVFYVLLFVCIFLQSNTIYINMYIINILYVCSYNYVRMYVCTYVYKHNPIVPTEYLLNIWMIGNYIDEYSVVYILYVLSLCLNIYCVLS